MSIQSSQKKAAMSLHEAVAYSGLSRSTLYRLIEAGTLRSIKVCGRRLIRPDELDSFLESFAEGGAK